MAPPLNNPESGPLRKPKYFLVLGMPEGPEVKTVATTLARHLVGKKLGTLWHSPMRLRIAPDYEGLKRLENQLIDDVHAYGKVMFMSINKKPAIMAQLGMTGQLKVEAQNAPVLKHTHVRWPLKDSSEELRYVDPRRFGLITSCSPEQKSAVLKRLGPDPFDWSPDERALVCATMKKSERAIKEILLDQSVVVGVGNIYASEALFLAGIHPERKGSQIGAKEYEMLMDTIRSVLLLAYKNNGTTFSSYVDGSGKKGDNLGYLKVFQKEHQPCPSCNTVIIRIKQGGRSTFFCPKCQK